MAEAREAREALAARVRAALPPERTVREVSMFGGLSFMVDDRMLVAVGRAGGLLVRVDPDRSAQLLARPDAQPAVMGADRPMGPGWITVPADGLTTDRQLADWLEIAFSFHRTAAVPAPSKGRS